METLSLVPWVENKIVAASLYAKSRVYAFRRLREYEQMIRWTKSSLYVSSVFDWGHTCEIALAIDSAASDVLKYAQADVDSQMRNEHGKRTAQFFFCSRTLLAKASGEQIPRNLWSHFIARLIIPKFDLNVPKDGILAELLPYLGVGIRLCSQYFFSPVNGSLDRFAYSNEAVIATNWILGNEVAEEQWAAFKESHDANWTSQRLSSRGIKSVLTIWHESIEIDELKRELEVTKEVLRLMDIVFNVFCEGVVIQSDCGRGGVTSRQRALAVEACQGLNVTTHDHRGTSVEKEGIQWFGERWLSLRSKWLDFISNWDAIVQKASGIFPFPCIPDIDGLVLHDMVTGYVGSSRLLRTGGKFTGRNGTTIVHPYERAAVVSSGCTLLSVEDSAISRHSMRRTFATAAEEFARYALLRCDLVKRSRMNFRDAVSDWGSEYTSWDRAPESLSAWTRDEVEDFTTDDYRLVLLRQALGNKNSIQIMAAPKVECSAFGSFLPNAPRARVPDPADKTLVIDQPVKATVQLYQGEKRLAKEGITEIPVYIKDTCGGRQQRLRDRDGYYIKLVSESGKPGIFTLTGPGGRWRRGKRRDDIARQNRVSWVNNLKLDFYDEKVISLA